MIWNDSKVKKCSLSSWTNSTAGTKISHCNCLNNSSPTLSSLFLSIQTLFLSLKQKILLVSTSYEHKIIAVILRVSTGGFIWHGLQLSGVQEYDLVFHVSIQKLSTFLKNSRQYANCCMPCKCSEKGQMLNAILCLAVIVSFSQQILDHFTQTHFTQMCIKTVW